MKTQMMQFRVTDGGKALIEKCAKKAGMMVSEYIRACMLMEAGTFWHITTSNGLGLGADFTGALTHRQP